jgi:hypothetical protein
MNAKSFLRLGAGGILCGSVYVLILATSVFICGALLILPERFGVGDFLFRQMLNNGWMSFITIPAFILGIVFPFYVARWFYRTCDRLAARYFDLPSPNDCNASTETGRQER